MRPGRYSAKEALQAALQIIGAEDNQGLNEYQGRLYEPNEQVLVGMLAKRQTWLSALKGLQNELSETIEELEAKG